MEKAYTNIQSGRGSRLASFLANVFSTKVVLRGLASLKVKEAKVKWLRYITKQAGYVFNQLKRLLLSVYH